MNNNETWVQNRWRPALGWSYVMVCLFDFIIAPLLWGYFQMDNGITPVTVWEPLTLQYNGLYHMAMGAVLGVTSWSRGQEKINGAAGK
jgi:hypothetical protein